MGRHLGIDFSSILVDFGRQVGVENRAKIDPKRHRKSDENQVTSWHVGRGLGHPVLRGRGLPDLKGGNLPGASDPWCRWASLALFAPFSLSCCLSFFRRFFDAIFDRF